MGRAQHDGAAALAERSGDPAIEVVDLRRRYQIPVPKRLQPSRTFAQALGQNPGLEAELKGFATAAMGGREPWDAMKCLVLMATAGEEAAWNSRHLSRGHRAIPLPSAEIVEQAPMIAQLVRQLGLDIEQVVQPRPDVVGELGGKTYNVFFVPHALGSSAIPAQDEFVRKYGIKSVIGCGGIHLTGDLYAAILFSRVEIPPESADRFRNIALDLKLCIAPFRDDRVFASDVGRTAA